MTRTRRLALATTVTTLGVIGVGGLVRATGSGDGCPDWPRCFGRWIPPLEYHALIEYSHRTIGAVAIGLLLWLAARVVRRHREERSILIPTLIAAPSILMQAVLGAIVVEIKTTPSLRWLEPWFVTFHIATAMGLVALLALVTVRTQRLGRGLPARALEPGPPGLRAWLRASVAGVFALMLAGAYVRGEHAGLVFGDFPLMDGRLIPRFDRAGAIPHFTHRALALGVGIIVITAAVKAWRARRIVPATAALAGGAAAAFLAQATVGGLQVLTHLSAPAVTAHVALAGLVFALVVAAAASAPRGEGRTEPAPPAGARRRPEPAPISGGQVDAAIPVTRAATRASTIGAYVRLTKPRIIVLLLITTVPAMALATGGWPDPWLTLATLVGGTLAAASANTFNMVLDRDIDALMARTRARPLPAHEVPPARAAAFALMLGATSLVFMTATVNLIAAVLAQAAIAFYVLVYTIGLKRSTPQNIVIGGAAGAMPVLVGWAAVTGTVTLEAWLLFAVIFAWTPPHFWALAMRHQKDYAAARVPMLPVVAGEDATRRQIVLYTAITVALSLALAPVASMGLLYLAAAVVLGAWFIADAVRMYDRSRGAPMRLFRTSISYLGLLFIAVGADAVL